MIVSSVSGRPAIRHIQHFLVPELAKDCAAGDPQLYPEMGADVVANTNFEALETPSYAVINCAACLSLRKSQRPAGR
jgi:hypothetical protein